MGLLNRIYDCTILAFVVHYYRPYGTCKTNDRIFSGLN